MRLPIAHRLLAEAALRGVKLTVEGDRIAYTPKDLMPSPLLSQLYGHQGEITALIHTLACCMAPRADVRRFVAALFLLARREGDRRRAHWMRWAWRDEVSIHLGWPMLRSRAEAAAAIALVGFVIGQRGRFRV